jgi:hypothetical protein
VLGVKKRGHDGDQQFTKASFSVLAPELPADLVADFGPDLVLELALDMALELARTLDCNSSSGAPHALAFATWKGRGNERCEIRTFATRTDFPKGFA